MKTKNAIQAMKMSVAVMMLAWGVAEAGEAYSSAGVTSNDWRAGQAWATGGYRGGGLGFGRTTTRSGRVNFAHGLGVGVDRTGISLSSSYALGAPNSKAVGGTLSMHIGLNGSASHSVGRVSAQGRGSRSVSAGGFAGSTRTGSRAGSNVWGRTSGPGRVWTQTHTRTTPARPVRLIARRAR